MAAVQVRALYDFEGDVGGGELSFVTNDILTVLRQDVGEGWWEAKTAEGKTGLIPEAYVEVTSFAEPSMPPPPPPAAVVPQSYESNNTAHQTPAWPQQQQQQQPTRPALPAMQTQQSSSTMQSQGSFDDPWDDDDWDDDNSSTTTETPGLQGAGNFGLSGANRDVKQRNSSTSESTKGYGTSRKGFSRFSKFTKEGGEQFLFGNVQIAESDKNAVIMETQNGPFWEGMDEVYNCTVDSPKKESKYKGIKSYIAYQIIPTFSGIQVSRRYKHFDWLHERLAAKFCGIVIPPLPDKQVTGRYEEEFIQERMRQLSMWIDRMCKHPVVSKSEVFNHFLTCTDEKRWKAGKRRAEKDEYQGGKFFCTIQAPATPIDVKDIDQKLAHYEKFTKSLDDSLKATSATMESNLKKHYGPYKKENQKIGHCLIALAKSFESDKREVAENLTKAIKHTGETYNEIGKMYEDQPKNDLIPLIDGLHEYKGLLSCIPDVIQVQKAAAAKVQEAQTKLAASEAEAATGRSNVIAYTVLAEMNHFNQHRVGDFKNMMQVYLKGQIDFHKEVTAKLEDTLRYYENA